MFLKYTRTAIIVGVVLLLLYPTIMELLFSNPEPLLPEEIDMQPAHLRDGYFINGEIINARIHYLYSVGPIYIRSIQFFFE